MVWHLHLQNQLDEKALAKTSTLFKAETMKSRSNIQNQKLISISANADLSERKDRSAIEYIIKKLSKK